MPQSVYVYRKRWGPDPEKEMASTAGDSPCILDCHCVSHRAACFRFYVIYRRSAEIPSLVGLSNY
ncbi:hypothetical protein LEMLEM_LOCUS1447 [Lemmus lemmus]